MIWEAYPRRTEKQPSHLECILNSLTGLNELNVEATRRIMKDVARRPVSRYELEAIVNSIYPRLQSWIVDLPRCIQDGQSSVPHIFLLHMYYHTTIMVLFGLLKTPLESSERTRLISPEEARETCIDSALQVAHMIRMHRTKWSIEYISAMAMHWVAIALFTLLDNLDEPRSRDAFVDLCFVARVFSRRWLLAKGILRMIQITAEKMNIQLPTETDTLLDDFSVNSWDVDKDARRLSSAYPNFILLAQRVSALGNTVDDPIDMDEWLAKWDGEKARTPDGRQFEIIAGLLPPCA
ncbi:C6 transcription factor, putative [Talaromyces islandicus]|uniref:C6 transcription factor, putative n=1 Tax=Talaromyces islandicus TaxID=28573 RepID=A0A0U1M9V4_TALIS|nr:C6 transcription factor, putative [Talaromyces islandicus]